MANRAERMSKLMDAVCKFMLDYIENKVPETGKFPDGGCHFEVYGTDNIGLFKVICRGEEERMLQLGVLRSGTDRLTSYFLPKGKKADLIQYLQSPETAQKLLEDVMDLSRSVDDFWD